MNATKELRRRGIYQNTAIKLLEGTETSLTKILEQLKIGNNDSEELDKCHRQFNTSLSCVVGHNSTMALSGTTTTNLNRTTKRSLSESSVDDLQRDNETDNKSRTSAAENMWRNELMIRSPFSANAQTKRRIKSTNHGVSDARNRVMSSLIDVLLRIALVYIFGKLERMEAFKRRIHTEELWLYKNPRTPDIVSAISLLITVVVAPFCATIFHLLLTRDFRDFRAASWSWTLALCLNGLVTSSLKVTIGRPRPDFFYRCFPDGNTVLKNISDPILDGTFDMFNCTGSAHDINEGRKSFPSGHASFAFNSFGFLCMYAGSKLHAFAAQGRGQTWRLSIALSPLYLATLIAISRTCDYHHHWQDVLAGSFIGLFTAYFAYRQYYPSIFATNCNRPYPHCNRISVIGQRKSSYMGLSNNDDTECENIGRDVCADEAFSVNTEEQRSLINRDDVQDNKWI